MEHGHKMEEVTMTVAYFSDTPNVTREQNQQFSTFVQEQRGGPGVAPDGGLFHAEGPTDDGGWWGFDIWESEAHFTRFHETILVPAFAQAGLDTVQLRRLEVTWDSTQVPG